MDNERKSKIVEKDFKFFSKILTFLTILCLLIFFSSFGFRDSRTSGWYQQWFPNISGSTITSITFLDSLTGYAVTNSNSLLQQYILKTTNGGDNWFINFTFNTPDSNWSFIKICFLNSNIGFAFSWTEMFKTTNSGNNWSMITYDLYPQDVTVINKDTMLAVQNSGFNGGVYRSTNGGINWHALGPTGGSGQPSRIYMFDKNIGFNLGSTGMKKTTNGGVNWFLIVGEGFADIKLIDTLIGWKTDGNMKKTTDGGITWNLQQLPPVSPFFNWMTLSIINKDSIWMCGGRKTINSFNYGIMFKTTNSGTNWGYQMADTSIKLTEYAYINFINKNIGWTYRPITGGVHTLNGGSDTTFYTGINNNFTTITQEYKLYQNYPNPFNAVTSIKYKVLKSEFGSQKSEVRIIVYDIQGKQVNILVNEKKSPGEYEIKFNGSNLSSGIYFYSLFADGIRVDTKEAVLLK